MASEQWPQTFKRVAARDLTIEEARAWTKAIKRDFPGIQDVEVIEVLEWAFNDANAKRHQRDSAFNYTQPMLSRWIREYRNAKRVAEYCQQCKSTGQFTLFCRRGPGGRIVELCTRLEFDTPMNPVTGDYGAIAYVYCTCIHGEKLLEKEVPAERQSAYREFHRKALAALDRCNAN